MTIPFGSGMRLWSGEHAKSQEEQEETEAGEGGSSLIRQRPASAHPNSLPVPSRPPAPPQLEHLRDCPRASHLSGSLPHLSPEFLVPGNHVLWFPCPRPDLFSAEGEKWEGRVKLAWSRSLHFSVRAGGPQLSLQQRSSGLWAVPEVLSQASLLVMTIRGLTLVTSVLWRGRRRGALLLSIQSISRVVWKAACMGPRLHCSVETREGPGSPHILG